MLDVLVVNLNCLQHTKNIIRDLKRQKFTDFILTVIDQNSVEDGTTEYLDILQTDANLSPIIIRNTSNVPLNQLWNKFVENSIKSVICILNNDIRIPSNFLSDVANIMSNNSSIGAVMHPTNHPEYDTTKSVTEFEILEKGKYRQGWDICIRKDVWAHIPEELTLYCGDDFIFEHMYALGYDAAIAISSPIIHYLGQTRKSIYNKILPERNPQKDIDNYRKMGYVHHMIPPEKYTIVDFSQSTVNHIKES